MIEEVYKGIWRIGVPLPGNPLKELNSYFLPGDERDLLIDTGFNKEECREALEQGLSELGARRERLDVYLTHFHSDHSGLAAAMAGPEGRIYMSDIDYRYMQHSANMKNFRDRNERFMHEGFPLEELKLTDRFNPAYRLAAGRPDERFVPLMCSNDPECGECSDEHEAAGSTGKATLTVGDFHLQMILCPGHTPGNTMLWEAEHGIMFTGDHILFDITPNITSWTGMGDSLGSYLENLEKAKRFDVKLALPGHRKSGDYQKRIDELLDHHALRLSEILDILAVEPGLTAYEITSRMRWKIRANSWVDFPAAQKWFAVGECLSHLDHLVLRGRVSVEETKEARYYYKKQKYKRVC